MSTQPPIKALRRANLLAITSSKKPVSLSAIAQAMGKPKMRTHLSNIAAGDKNMGDKLAANIEQALGLPAGWMDRQHLSTGEKGAPYVVDLQVSQSVLSDDLPLLSWEDLVHRPVPEIFRTILADDALAPDHPAGTEIVWTTRRRPAPGRMILVKDRHGQVHARQCHQGRAPGQWIAAPISPAYVAFDSHEEGVELLAVYKGRLEPDD